MKWDNRNEFNALISGQGHVASINLIRPFLTALWDYKWIVLACTLLMSLLGVLYVSQRPPSYTARGLLVVENTRIEGSRQELLPEISSVDVSTVDSQVEIIRSEAIALKVIETLKLAEDDQSEGLGASNWSTLIQYILTRTGLRDSDAAHVPQERTALVALPNFLSRLSVRRVGLSSVIEVGYKGNNPEQSAQIANEIIRTYLADQTASAAAAAASASAWLRDRIKDLGPRTRIISSANPPIQKDGPRRLALLSVFSGTGLLVGLGIAVLRYSFDTTLRDPSHAMTKLGLCFLGAVPKLHRRAARKLLSNVTLSGDQLPIDDPPRSDFAALVTRIRVAAGSRGAVPVIGFVSTTPREGSTTIAANVAFSAAATGLRVLLVDGNARETDLSRQLALGASKGLADVLAGTACQSETRLEIGKTGLHFLPKGSGDTTGPGLNRTQVRAITQKWLEEYDLVLIDLPPLVSVPDLGRARDMIGTFVLIIECGHVPSALVEGALSAAGLTQKDLLGFVFNRVKRSLANRFTFPFENYRWKNTSTRLR